MTRRVGRHSDALPPPGRNGRHPGLDGGLRAGAQHPVARRPPRALSEAKIKSRKSETRRERRAGRKRWAEGSPVACPASGESIQVCQAQQTQRTVAGAQARRVENHGQTAPTVSQAFSASSDSSWPSPHDEYPSVTSTWRGPAPVKGQHVLEVVMARPPGIAMLEA